MNPLKTIFYLFLIALVLGFFYLLAILGPKPIGDIKYDYSDPTIEGEQILKESERLESEFEKAASANALSEDAISKLRKSISLQEQYIDKAKTMDRSPAMRLLKLQTRLDNVETKPLVEVVDDLERKAEKAEKAGEIDRAREIFKQAYDIQSKINADYPHSQYKNIGRRVRFDREIKMLEARPTYLKSVEHETAARAAFAARDFEKARTEFKKTIEVVSQLHSNFPSSVYTDFARYMKLESDLASLESGGLEEKIKSYIADAAAAEKKGDYLLASESYSDAAETQRTLNRLYPKSSYVSEEKVMEFERKKVESYSWKFAQEILQQDKLLSDSLRGGKLANVGESAANLLRKTEHFSQNFPQSNLIDDEIVMRMRYITFILHEIEKIRNLVLESLLPVDKNGTLKMMKNEVSQKLYSLVMQENPSRYTDNPELPVDSVTYDDVRRFCNRINWLLGRNVDLPDEKTFRSAVGSLRYSDINDISWNNMNSGGKTHPVATKKPNDRGFFDLIGNVAEYVAPENSKYVEEVKTIGGSAQTSSDILSDLPVISVDPRQRNRMIGFRIVVDFSDPKPVQNLKK